MSEQTLKWIGLWTYEEGAHTGSFPGCHDSLNKNGRHKLIYLIFVYQLVDYLGED